MNKKYCYTCKKDCPTVHKYEVWLISDDDEMTDDGEEWKNCHYVFFVYYCKNCGLLLDWKRIREIKSIE